MSSSWQQMLARIATLVRLPGELPGTHKEAIRALLSSYSSSEADFAPYVHFDFSGYTKNLVQAFGDRCNVIVMCWAPNQQSAWHGHEGSRCFVKVLGGQLVEQQVPYPSSQPSDGAGAMQDYTSRLLERNQVHYIDDYIGLHKVTNKSPTEPAITLHVYMPAYTKCRVFQADEARQLSLQASKQLEVTFFATSAQ